MPWLALAGDGLAVNGLNAHLAHQADHPASTNACKARAKQQITHHAAACIRTVQMQAVPRSHQREIRFRHGHRLVIRRRSGHAKNLGLLAHWQFMTLVNQRFALKNPALVSALSKKSFQCHLANFCMQHFHIDCGFGGFSGTEHGGCAL